MEPAQTLVCTVGTSLFNANLDPLAKRFAESAPALGDVETALARAYAAADWRGVAVALSAVKASDRICGAEINSVGDLVERGHCAPDCNLIFCHSATPAGTQIATVLEHYFRARGHLVQLHEVVGLQDADPRLFRTTGLRNLAKVVCQTLRE
jgi:CRISPR/Cas system-associated protein Csm6